MSDALKERKPWPMKWVIVTILVVLVPFTYLNLRYRKPGPAYRPYQDAQDRANVVRLLSAGYRRITLAAQRPADTVRGPTPAPTLPATGGLPDDLVRTLVQRPLLPAEIRSVTAAGSLKTDQPYAIQFTCTLPDNNQQLAGAGQRDAAPELAAQQARIRRKQARYADARTVLAEARKKWPDEADLAYLDAMIVQDQGDEPGSLALMTAVVERFPKHAGALNFVGFSWAEKGVRLPEAEAYIRRALEAEPDDGAIVDSLGWVLFKRGDLKGARTELERAISLMPGEGELHFHLAEVLLAAGDRAAGITALEKAVELAAAGGPGADASRKRWQQRLDAVRKKGKGR